ncbi:MAG: HAD hydrolase-like protein, partial [Thermoplasmata archaeon]|nr:HAD hydrolase-like protein [Thermoplasmata archaeon]
PEPVARAFLTRTGLPTDVPLFADPGIPEAPRLPTAAAFRAARKLLGSKTARVVYVGDLYWSDVRAAARAGLEPVLLDRTDAFEGLGGTRIRSLSELPALLERAPIPAPVDSPPPPDGP